jgi:hypothetical protein
MLRVFCNGQDITMTYDATFMLYASLEVARPIASGKMHVPAVIPVLTGVTVASAAYLEKPQRAAYFIFPDLSVRHEGFYRLRFSLFEGIKHEADADSGKPFDTSVTADSPTPVRHEGVFNRMDVVSTSFRVWSAKKFPGLERSTELSINLSDQGCRVRIRRDVRQRKRPVKADPDAPETPSSYHGTPHAMHQSMDHSRSASRSSQYDRCESVDGRTYGRPTLPMPSPVLPSPISSMPPPSVSHQSLSRPMLDSLPRPSASQTSVYRRPELPPMPSPSDLDRQTGYTLPPIRDLGDTVTQASISQPRYPSIPPLATKRPHASSYGQHPALKFGARPNGGSDYPTLYAPNGEDTIEADTEDQDDFYDAEERPSLTGALTYARASGEIQRHPARLVFDR